MTAVRISGTFKKDERPFNGLEAIAESLLDHSLAGQDYTVVAKVRAHASRWTAEDGEEIPTAKITRVEVVDGDDAAAVEALIKQQYRKRTGQSSEPTLFDDEPAGEDGPSSERARDEWLDEK